MALNWTEVLKPLGSGALMAVVSYGVARAVGATGPIPGRIAFTFGMIKAAEAILGRYVKIEQAMVAQAQKNQAATPAAPPGG